tara:strand:- start:2656 stop:2829 length:174 start_codon:yes stop_codon:yes gene_type:complete
MELKDLYAKWYMVLLARMFGKKHIGMDVTNTKTYTTTGYNFKGTFYITECTITTTKE